MKNFIFFTLVSILTFQSCAQKNEKDSSQNSSTYYLIRHAEKDRSDATNRDPDLKAEGLQRAQNWANHFKDIKFDAVYSTDYNRTKQTAAPTARANNLELQFYNPTNIQFEDFLKKTKGQTVLIVGHSNTTPMFANGLLGEEKYRDMEDDDNSKLFKITISKDNKKSEVIDIN